MGRGEPGIGPSLTTQHTYFRQENGLRQPALQRCSRAVSGRIRATCDRKIFVPFFGFVGDQPIRCCTADICT
jgi:hypothetical protein